jgi:hypothetical protein
MVTYTWGRRTFVLIVNTWFEVTDLYVADKENTQNIEVNNYLSCKWKLIFSCFKKYIMMKWRYINTISQPKPNQNNKTTKVIKGDNKNLCHITNLICVKNNYNNWKHKNKNVIYFFQTMLSSPLLKKMFVWCCLSMPSSGM